ncbi:sporulation membrane protein YtaF [Ammoniphilus oxalaticus]|uniref:Sporulation membrane protein YtaF n=1 Tax=Ammoniphilus oxalaticus TaxID=66863 RepID=A0A419SIF8_9BACL|nr:sporulation membrane protein YtaF [Ammoniphilus oxalaticus]RKD23793.1 sporulation membrane protein YtaF [Ammoniphilus oxalaticus]
MLHLVSLLAIAFAVSLDGFGVGISYGLRRIKIPLSSILIITFCTAVVIVGSMNLGQLLAEYIDLEAANLIGAWVLIGVGCWSIFNLYQNKETQPGRSEAEAVEVEQSPKQVLKLEIKILGLVVHILKKPTIADMDKSGEITAGEATLLGFALSMDAFGAGFGAALMGFSPWSTGLVVSALCTLFILLGLRIGFMYSNIAWVKRLSFIPGVILILFGISRIW